jgi:hypothetical protein
VTALETLARKLLRAELAARGARDLDAAEAAIAPRLRFDPETLEHVSLDVISARPGHPNADLAETLERTMKESPELFGGQSVPPGRVGQPPAYNPFLPGPRHSLTEGMRIFAENETLGRELMRDAGFKMDLDR